MTLQIQDLVENAEKFFNCLPDDLEVDNIVKCSRKLEGPAFITSEQLVKMGLSPLDLMALMKKAELAVEGVEISSPGEADILAGITFARNELSLESADMAIFEFMAMEDF